MHRDEAVEGDTDADTDAGAGTATDVAALVGRRYDKVAKLGEGTYGKVYLATDRTTGESVALKKITLYDGEEGIPAGAVREIAMLKRLGEHPNIVQLYRVLCDGSRIWLVFEHLDRDLRQYLNYAPTPDAALIQSYTFQMLNGLYFCHENSILHRDLKPQNILIDARGRLKLADFGLSRAAAVDCAEGRYTQEVVTLWYRAPEILLGGDTYGAAVDLWSAGCIIAEMVTRSALFPGDCEIDQLHAVFSRLGLPSEPDWPGVSAFPGFAPFEGSHPRAVRPYPFTRRFRARLGDDGVALLNDLLRFDPAQRISAFDALSHPYFDGISLSIRAHFTALSCRLQSFFR